jgi:hypothetical protein
MVSVQGRYAYGRRSQQQAGAFIEPSLLASVQFFGGAAGVEPGGREPRQRQPGERRGLDPGRRAQRLLLRRADALRRRLAAAALPAAGQDGLRRVVKQLQQFPELAGSIKALQSGGTKIERSPTACSTPRPASAGAVRGPGVRLMSFLYPRAVTIRRPAAQPGEGKLSYGGQTQAGEADVPGVTWPVDCNIQLRREGQRNTTGVPGDANRPTYDIRFPRSSPLSGARQGPRHRVDDLGRRYRCSPTIGTASATPCASSGWRPDPWPPSPTSRPRFRT